MCSKKLDLFSPMDERASRIAASCRVRHPAARPPTAVTPWAAPSPQVLQARKHSLVHCVATRTGASSEVLRTTCTIGTLSSSTQVSCLRTSFVGEKEACPLSKSERQPAVGLFPSVAVCTVMDKRVCLSQSREISFCACVDTGIKMCWLTEMYCTV